MVTSPHFIDPGRTHVNNRERNIGIKGSQRDLSPLYPHARDWTIYPNAEIRPRKPDYGIGSFQRDDEPIGDARRRSAGDIGIGHSYSSGGPASCPRKESLDQTFGHLNQIGSFGQARNLSPPLRILGQVSTMHAPPTQEVLTHGVKTESRPSRKRRLEDGDDELAPLRKTPRKLTPLTGPKALERAGRRGLVCDTCRKRKVRCDHVVIPRYVKRILVRGSQERSRPKSEPAQRNPGQEPHENLEETAYQMPVPGRMPPWNSPSSPATSFCDGFGALFRDVDPSVCQNCGRSDCASLQNL